MDQFQDDRSSQADAGGQKNNIPRQDEPLNDAVTDDTVSVKIGTTQLDAPPGASSQPARSRPRPKTDTVVIPNAGRMVAMQIARQKTATAERQDTFRRWLETRSKDDLIDMLLSVEGQPTDTESTDKMSRIRVEQTAPPAEEEGFKIPADLVYHRLPATRRAPLNEQALAWKIVLVCLDQTADPTGLMIDGEITIGRIVGDTAPDLDLGPYEAKRKGVSRIHARLVPTVDRLILVDNESSNGTYWNRLRVSAGAGQPIKDGDVIAFGRANFLVKIVKAPDPMATRTLI